MGLLCMSEPLKAQPSDVLIFMLTFPALSALAWLEKVIPSHRAGAEAVTLSESPLLGFPHASWGLPHASYTLRRVLLPFSSFFSPFPLHFPHGEHGSPSTASEHSPIPLPFPLCFAYKLLCWKE